MAKDYTITGQQQKDVKQPDGTWEPMMLINFTTNTEPPTQGTVQVPVALLKDKAKYAETVKQAIEEAAGAHIAVAGL